MSDETDKDRPEAANFVPTGIAARRLHRHPDTLRAMMARREIEVIRTATGRILWNVDAYIARQKVVEHAA